MCVLGGHSVPSVKSSPFAVEFPFESFFCFVLSLILVELSRQVAMLIYFLPNPVFSARSQLHFHYDCFLSTGPTLGGSTLFF